MPFSGPVRQRVARLRLLIYTSCGAAAAAAPGPATATAASATATASASEVQRSRRLAATATAAWKFIYFSAMIWQYFNGNRISPSSTHSCLFSSLTTLSALFLSTLVVLYPLYSLPSLLLASICTFLRPPSQNSPHFSFSTLALLPSLTHINFSLSALLHTLLTLLTLLPIHCSLPHLFSLLSLHSPCSSFQCPFSSLLSTLFFLYSSPSSLFLLLLLFFHSAPVVVLLLQLCVPWLQIIKARRREYRIPGIQYQSRCRLAC